MVFLAVKPHLIVPVAEEIKPAISSSSHLVVSVAVSVTTKVIEEVK